MGSLHCARICMDVIAALIGRCQDRPAPCLAPPTLEKLLRAAPPLGTEQRGPRRWGGAGVPGAEGAGRGSVRRRPQAGGGDLGRTRAGARVQTSGGGLAVR
jgi:hypothetical protein